MSEKAKGNGFASMAFDAVSVIATAVVSVAVVFLFLFRTVGVVGGSMEPTLNSGDRIVLTAGYGEPVNGDIVVTCQPDMSNVIPDTLVKRIIATEGQKVDIDFVKGKVYVDDVELDKSLAVISSMLELGIVSSFLPSETLSSPAIPKSPPL